MKSYEKGFEKLFDEMRKVVIGQDEVLRQMMVAILCDANALLEGYPGLAKTLAVRTLAKLMDLKFSRIQSTPDLMPSDITGTYIIQERDGKREFKFQPGPIFANILLTDEINRATPKTQSALLEAMQEKQVTVGNETFKLDRPFFVLATQNPIEQEGSLSLNESVLVNGTLKTGKELLEQVRDCLAEDEKGTKLYDILAWTYALNPRGRFERSPCFFYTVPYEEELITVTTRTGRNITVTKNHPFLVNEQGSIRWKKAEELSKQDILVQPASFPQLPSMSVMTHEAAIARMQQRPIQEIPFDEDFAFWIAFLLADGSIGENCVEACQKNYPEALDRFIAISRKYGFSPKIRSRNGCRYAKIYSKPLVEYLSIRFGITGGKDKEIPSWFLGLSPELNKEFLRTFIALESSLRDRRIVFTQKSRQNVNLIAYMLLRQGILSWIREEKERTLFRLKIQGADLITYLRIVGWLDSRWKRKIDLGKAVKSSFRIVPVDRSKILWLVELLGLNSFHTLRKRTAFVHRSWYGSYKGIKEGETVMAVDALQKMVKDIRKEIRKRKEPPFLHLRTAKPRAFAAGIGLSMVAIAKDLGISKNQVWQLYATGNCMQEVQILDLLQDQYTRRMAEAEALLQYCEQLLSEDVFYDPIKRIRYRPSEGLAFGLTVPGLQNYVGGFGACGINHNTYPLPEAQADRFLLKIITTYPSYEDELKIVDKYSFHSEPPSLPILINKKTLFALQTLVRQVPIATDLKHRIVKIVTETRKREGMMEYGASPRASIGLVLACKARALMEGRNYVSSKDIETMAYPVLRHRIILNFEAVRKGIKPEDAIRDVLAKVK